jgi:hypothetical protein
VADCGILSCQTAMQFERATNLDIKHFTCHYLYKMLPAGFSISFIELLHFQFITNLILFFGSAKSDGKQTGSIAIFGLCVGLCELQLCLAVWAGSIFILYFFYLS